MRARILGLLLALLPALAAAQGTFEGRYPPANWLANPGGTRALPSYVGPGPMLSWNGQALQSWQGVAHIMPAPGQSSSAAVPWIATDPWGSAINCTGTATHCVNETLAAAANGAYSVIVDCLGRNGGGNPAPLNPTSTVTFPPRFGGFVEFRQCQLSSSANPAIFVDSHDGAKYIMHMFAGTSATNGDVLLVKPTNTGNGATSVAGLNGTVYLEGAAAPAGGRGCVVDGTNGGFKGEHVWCMDPNAGAYGIAIVNATQVIEELEIHSRFTHGQTTAGIACLTSSTNQANVRNIRWHLNRISPNGATDGFSSWCQNDTVLGGVRVSNEEGSVTNGFHFQAGSTGAVVQNAIVTGASVSLVDGGSNNSANINNSWVYGSAAGSLQVPPGVNFPNSIYVAGNQQTFPGSAQTIVGTTASQSLSSKTIDNSSIGATTPSTGAFTTLTDRAGTSSTNIPVGGTLCKNTTPTGNGADATADVLQSCTLPANAFSANGNRVRIVAYGHYAANGNTKTMTALFGATSLYNSGGVTASGASWIWTGDVWRTGSNTQRYGTPGMIQGASVLGVGGGTAAETDSGTITIVIKGQSGSSAANDIVCDAMFVEMLN